MVYPAEDGFPAVSLRIAARPLPRPEIPMTITVTRDRTGSMRHVAHVRTHRIPVDELAPAGGEDSGPTPHDLYDAALASCKALTVLWYANRKGIPVEDIAVTVERDDTDERKGIVVTELASAAN